MAYNKKWTEEDCQFLSDNWGNRSIDYICKKLGRTKNSINVKVFKLGLGPFLEQGEYVTWNKLLKTLGISTGGDKIKTWVEKRNFPVVNKRVGKNSCRIVYIDEFWKWAKNNKEFVNFSKFEENSLGKEPEWVKEKRRMDFEKSVRYKRTKWTSNEDARLKILLSQHKYSYDDLSKMLQRTTNAIERRMVDLKIKARPVTADNHTPWTKEEDILLCNLIKNGFGYELIAEKFSRSSKAIRGHVYSMYITENLDKVRRIIGDKEWGDNRPERKIKNIKVMSIDERKKTKELLLRLLAVLSVETQDIDIDLAQAI